MCEHLGIPAITGKRIKGDDDSAIKEHILFCNNTPGFNSCNQQQRLWSHINGESSNQ